MRTANFPAIGTLDRTLPDTSDPEFQTASLSLTLHDIIKDLSDQGFVFTQAQTSDFTTFGTDTQDAIDDYMTRADELLRTGTSAVVAALPAVLPIIAALLSGGATPVISILLQGVLDTIARHFDIRADVAEGDPDNKDVSEIVTQLVALNLKLQTAEEDNISDTMLERMTALIAQIEVTLNEFTINLASDPMHQAWSVEPQGG